MVSSLSAFQLKFCMHVMCYAFFMSCPSHVHFIGLIGLCGEDLSEKECLSIRLRSQISFQDSLEHILNSLTSLVGTEYQTQYEWCTTLLVIVTGWYRTKRSKHCDHYVIYCAPRLSSNHSRVIYQSYMLWLQQIHLVAKREKLGEKCP
jgi:hypothetical protein